MVNRISNENMKLKIEIEVAILKEDDFFVAYCPALELSGYGKTEEEAKVSFNTELSIFLEETTKRGTLEKYLIRNGWTLHMQNYKPPKTSRELLSKSQGTLIRHTSQNIQVPIC